MNDRREELVVEDSMKTWPDNWKDIVDENAEDVRAEDEKHVEWAMIMDI